MSQPPNYVVRQDTGGKLKLLLIRDPRAAHVAKVSPVKKQPEAVSLSLSNTTAQQASSSASHVTTAAAPTTLRLSDTAAGGGTSASASSSSFGSSLSPTLLTKAATQAMGQGSLAAASSTGGSTTPTKMGEGKKSEGVRVKGGRIIKLHYHRKSPKKSPPATLQSSVLQPLTASKDSLSADTSGGRGKTDPTPRMLPVSRVRTIMRTDVHTSSTTNSISQDSVALVAKATELFIAQLARDAHKVAMAAAERDVSYRHLSAAVRRAKKTEFLHDILPGKVVVRDHLGLLGNQTDHTHSNNGSTHSSQ